ncbi:TonB-dependent receptor [Alteraurantiacibacter aquimixticola]|uniref:TonB-dependent receptor n=1 Tax=Alteraurantiacibacter aquimixticola TaxID=2489173 RepID=UPI00145B9DFE|nr:TonB-dependent receptor [Alteraurantiacibacter aquimixticola]
MVAIALHTGFGSVAYANEAEDESAYAADQAVAGGTIVVTGYKDSLNRAEEIKKETTGTRETILAEDIAAFPEHNLADALQRIPGITITREAGEGRQIQLRGLGPDFTQVTLNGMEALATTSSAMDSRGSVSRTRGFDYNIFASELFNRVDVYKTYSAELDEGGLAGTVALTTARPFDYDGFQAAFSAQGVANDNVDTIGKRFAALISNNWGDFGLLASVAYSRRDVSETGYDTVRWRRVDSQNADISALPQATQDLIEDKQLWFPRGARPIIFDSDTERLGATIALQWQPTDGLRLGIDGLYGELNANRDEFHIQHATGTSTGMGCYQLFGEIECASVTELEFNSQNHVTYYSLLNTTLASESKVEDADSTIEQLVFNADWQLSDSFHMSGLAGREETTFIDNSAKVYMVTRGDMTLDFTQGFTGLNTYHFDTLDPTRYTYSDLDIWQPQIENRFDTAKLDFDYSFDPLIALRFGASFKRYRNEYSVVENENINKAGFNDGSVDGTVDPDVTFVSDATGAEWLSVDVLEVYRRMGIERYLPEPDRKHVVIEETMAGYALFDLQDIPLGQGSLRSNIGVRYYDTQITSEGHVGDTPVSIERSYDGFLPTLNLAWDVTDELVLRASAGKNLTRVALGSLNVAGRVNSDASSGGDLTISAGNPDLRPMKSWNFELGAEYYFPEGGYLSAAFFYKDITDIVGSSSVDVRYGDTGYPLSLLGDVDGAGNPQTADTIFQFNRPANVNDSTVKGFEVGLRHDFDFLPAPFDKLGIIANYTYADGETLYENVGGTGLAEYKGFPGLSNHTANVTLYYEAERWGMRVSTAYRSGYISQVQSGNTDENERGFHGSNFVDFTSHYAITDNLKANLSVLNITDEAVEQYSDTADRLYGTTTSGRTYMLRLGYTF